VKLTILWHPAARFVFYRLPIHTATLVDRAIIRFAERGEGELEWAPPYHRLRAGLHDMALAIDREKRTVTVVHIFRAR